MKTASKSAFLVVCCLLLLTACGSKRVGESAGIQSSPNALTGMPGINGPVLFVKIDDTQPAHPQIGLDKADVVYIEEVEGGLTRLAAVFSNALPPFIGPIRSARISDIDLMASYGHPAFAYSGAQKLFLPVIEAANIENLGAELEPPSIYSRDPGRQAPTNMLLDPQALLTKAIVTEKRNIDTAKSVGWKFGPLPKTGVPILGVDLKWPASSYQLTWSVAQKRWLLMYRHEPDLGSDGIQLGLMAGGCLVNGGHLRGPFMRFVPPRKQHWLQALPTHPFITNLIAFAYRTLPAQLLRPFLMRFVTTALAPDAGLWKHGAILVNKYGHKISGDYSQMQISVSKEPEGLAYIIFGKKIANDFSNWPNFISTAPGVAYAYLKDYKNTRPDLYFESKDIVDLAEKLDISEINLRKSLEGHDFSHNGPLYALGPAKAYVVFTNGGLMVSSGMNVLDSLGNSIKGLFAAGSNGQGGMLLEGHGHHLLWAFVSGRIAGKNAAFEATDCKN